MDGENAVRTAKRLTVCVVCDKKKTRNHFMFRGKTCAACREVTKDRRCARCGHNKPAGEFIVNGKLCADCRKGEPREGWEGSNCLRCTSVEDCQFLNAFYLPVLCGTPDEDDWYNYSKLPADVALKAAGLVYFEKFKPVQGELL